jgi:CRISPR-associated protein Cas6
VVDVVFGLAGTSVPLDYAYALWAAVRERLRWLDADPRAGIHPLRVVATGYGVALLPRRAKLTLRVSREHATDALALCGASLRVGDAELRVGAGAERPLRDWATLYASQVTTGAVDEPVFASDVATALRALRVRCGGSITGRQRRASAGGREIVGFSVLLDGLAAADSLRVQCEGLGGARAQGWGIFVPHKRLAAVS